MTYENLFEKEEKHDSGRTKQILDSLYDEDKLDFNTELTSSQIFLFSELEILVKDDKEYEGDKKWDWVNDFIKTYERKVVSRDRKGRKEIIGLRNHEHDNDNSRK